MNIILIYLIVLLYGLFVSYTNINYKFQIYYMFLTGGIFIFYDLFIKRHTNLIVNNYYDNLKIDLLFYLVAYIFGVLVPIMFFLLGINIGHILF